MGLLNLIAPEYAKKRELEKALHSAKLDVIKNYAYGGASYRRNDMKGFSVTDTDPDGDIGDNLTTLRARSRELFMNSPLATGALKTIRTNVVGSGLKLNAAIDYEFLGLTNEQANEWEKNTEREFRLWSDSVNCDASRQKNFGQLQQLALLSALMNGDSFALMPHKKRAGSPYSITVQLVEGDRVRDPQVSNGKNIYNGVELDETGEAVAFYIHSQHENSTTIGKDNVTRVEIFGKETGAPNVLQITQDWERIGQRRGTPLLSPVIVVLKQLSRYTEAELAATLVSSMFTAFIKTERPQQDLPGLSMTPDGERVSDYDEAIELSRGGVVALDPGQDIATANPTRDTGAFDGFIQALTRQIGAALEIPNELLLKHFTASYSASRGALLEFWKMADMRRQVLAGSFCQPIYQEWLAEAVAIGRIKAPGFFSDPAIKAAWCGAEWIGPKQGSLNPLQEMNAHKVAVENNFTTIERVIAETSGMSAEDVLSVRKREMDQLKKDGTLKNPSDYELEGVVDEVVTD